MRLRHPRIRAVGLDRRGVGPGPQVPRNRLARIIGNEREVGFEGAVDYCVLRSPMTGQYFNCDRSQAVTNVHCESTNHRLILARQ